MAVCRRLGRVVVSAVMGSTCSDISCATGQVALRCWYIRLDNKVHLAGEGDKCASCVSRKHYTTRVQIVLTKKPSLVADGIARPHLKPHLYLRADPKPDPSSIFPQAPSKVTIRK